MDGIKTSTPSICINIFHIYIIKLMFKISLYLRSSSVIGTSAMPIPRIHVIDNKIPVIIRTGCGNCLYFIGHRTAKYRSILNIILKIHINCTKLIIIYHINMKPRRHQSINRNHQSKNIEKST